MSIDVGQMCWISTCTSFCLFSIFLFGFKWHPVNLKAESQTALDLYNVILLFIPYVVSTCSVSLGFCLNVRWRFKWWWGWWVLKKNPDIRLPERKKRHKTFVVKVNNEVTVMWFLLLLLFKCAVFNPIKNKCRECLLPCSVFVQKKKEMLWLYEQHTKQIGSDRHTTQFQPISNRGRIPANHMTGGQERGRWGC